MQYLGPNVTQMIVFFVLFAANCFALFVIGLLFVRNVWCLGANVTTIEGWEIERHKTLVRRARALGGYLDGPDGTKVKVSKQEFPYDIGILQNIRQGMGGTFLLWLWPFAPTPANNSGLAFEVNGFEGKDKSSKSCRSLLDVFRFISIMATSRSRPDAQAKASCMA